MDARSHVGAAFGALGATVRDSLALVVLTALLAVAWLPLLGLRALLPLLPRRAACLVRLVLGYAAYLGGFSLTCLRGSLRIRLARLPEADRSLAFDDLAATAGMRCRRQAKWLARTRVVVEDPPPKVDPSLPVVVIARHAGLLNSQMALALMAGALVVSPRGIAKRCIAAEPGMRALLRGVPLVLFRWNRSGRAAAAAQLTVSGRALGPEEGFWLFPEDTNFSSARRRAALSALRLQGAEDRAERAEAMPHVLPPHVTGALALLRGAPEAQVLVFGHTGLEDLMPWTLPADYPPGDGSVVRMRWWSFRTEEVPREAEPLADWLDDRWQAVDDWIRLSREDQAAHPAGRPVRPRRLDAA